MLQLRKYWFKFSNPPEFNSLGFGCGVTAYNADDAVQILNEKVFSSTGVLGIESVVEDVILENLDSGHVIP